MTDFEIVAATGIDAAELLVLTRACWVQEAIENDTLDIPALNESLAQVRSDLERWDTYIVRRGGRLVASVRGRLAVEPDGGSVWEIGRLMVAPDLQGAGLGRRLLDFIVGVAPDDARGFSLYTGARSMRNQRMYQAAGFVLRLDLTAPPSAVILTRDR
ncbi:GNAT family N-acetyltransferase [Glaciibacter flavus]|uniref:GNAT family N-acetyltransferase n=1 Tax=Orlajensenia flava TaxID=2565934 RepID=UPI003B00B17A